MFRKQLFILSSIFALLIVSTSWAADLRSSAEGGDIASRYALALSYEEGTGETQSYAEAAKWYELAAKQGDVKSQFALARLYYEGQGVPQDKAEAFRWYREAAEQGYPAAQFNVGVMYWDGEGVDDNRWNGHRRTHIVAAYMWLLLAEQNGDEQAGRWLDMIEWDDENEIYADEIAVAKKMAADWLASRE